MPQLVPNYVINNIFPVLFNYKLNSRIQKIACIVEVESLTKTIELVTKSEGYYRST